LKVIKKREWNEKWNGNGNGNKNKQIEEVKPYFLCQKQK